MNDHADLPSIDPVGDEDRPWFRIYPEAVSTRIDPIAEASLSDMVARAAQAFGDRVAFSNLGGELTFSDVDDLATRFAAYLQRDLGLRKGDRIVLQMPNLLQYPVALFGALRAGLIVVNANPLYTVKEMRDVFQDAQPRAIVVLATFADKVEKVVPDTTIEHVIVTKVGDLLTGLKRPIVNLVADKIKKMVPDYDLPKAIDFRAAVVRSDPAGFSDPSLEPGDVAFLQYTGGTTGGTKAAVLTHWNLLANQDQFMGQVRNTLGEDRQSTVIAALPLYHVFALTVNCIGLFRFGAHNVLITNPRDIPAFIKDLDRTKPDLLVLVSTLAAALMDNPSFASLDLSHLRITVAGGMAVRSSVAQRWNELTGQDIFEGYGLTEASPVVTVNPTHIPARIGSIGIPLPSTDVVLLSDDGQPVPLGQPGELAVRGPQVMRGYWNNPEETAEVITSDGWLLTGDIATVDADGFFAIVDRKKEIIVVSGFNVYPGELEDAAMQHPKVAEAGAIGVDDERAGEVPKLYVVRRDDSLTEAELREHLRTLLTGYKRPQFVEFIDELPKSNVGKVLRRGLKERELEGAGGQAG